MTNADDRDGSSGEAASWERLEALFERCSALPEEEREAFLDRECGDDAQLRGELERLLASATEGEEFLRPLAERSLEIGKRFAERIGRYRIVSLLGQGGMGLVFLAEQHRPKRLVALKIVRPGVATRRMLRRFEMEGQVLGRLQHPGIAQIYEADTADTGEGPQPYFVMEYVRGKSLLEHVRARDLGTRERLGLLKKVCDAVQHAHRRGIIHRDLKPTNILVDEDGNPKILDFGVARATDQDVKSTTLATDIGQLIGTVPYMSPEQTSGDSDELDTRSDVYALGVIGYELLTDRLPYELAEKMVHDALRTIREDPPTPLSTAGRVFRGDLETIFGKALMKERSRRYQSASDLAADIGRYLRDEPIEARRPSVAYHVRMFARRRRAAFASIAAISATLVAATALSLGFAFRAAAAGRAAVTAEQHARLRADEAERGRREAEEARREAADARERAMAEAETVRAVNAFLDDMLSSADPRNARGREVSVRFVLDEAAGRLAAGALGDRPEIAAAVHRTVGNTYAVLAFLEPAERHLRQALELRREALPPAHPAVLESLSDLADLLALSEPERAEALFREAVAAATRELGEDHPDVATRLLELAQFLKTQFEPASFEEAEALMREALRIRREALGEGHADVAESMTVLGGFLARSNRHEEALELLHGAVAIARESGGGENVEVAKALEGLAAGRFLSGDREGALETMREAFAIRQRVQRDHPDTVEAMTELAQALSMMGRLEEAEPLFRQALESARESFGDDHPNVAFKHYGLGRLLVARGDLASGVVHIEEAVRIGSAAGVAEDAGWAALKLAELYQEQERFEEAEDRLVRTLEELEGRVADGGALTAAIRSELEALYRRLGREELADALAEEEVSSDPRDINAQMHQMMLHGRRGDLEGTRAALANVATMIAELPEPVRVNGSNNLAERGWELLEVGQPAAAALVLRECLAVRAEVLPGHWREHSAKYMLGTALVGTDELEEAERLLLESHAGLARTAETIPSDWRDSLLAGASLSLARCYEALGRPEEAARWRAEHEAAAEDAEDE